MKSMPKGMKLKNMKPKERMKLMKGSLRAKKRK